MMKILLIEDNPEFAQALSIRLGSLGYSLNCASSMSSALSRIVSSTPDVALIDINLPDGNGFALAEQFQRNPNIDTTPVIFMTASKDQKYREISQRYSPIAFLEKPFDAGVLIDAIEHSQYSRQHYRARYKANY